MTYNSEIVKRIKDALPNKGLKQISINTKIPYQTVATEFSRIKESYNEIIMDEALKILKSRGFDTEKLLNTVFNS